MNTLLRAHTHTYPLRAGTTLARQRDIEGGREEEESRGTRGNMRCPLSANINRRPKFEFGRRLILRLPPPPLPAATVPVRETWERVLFLAAISHPLFFAFSLFLLCLFCIKISMVKKMGQRDAGEPAKRDRFRRHVDQSSASTRLQTRACI